jgi:predicted nucleic-acid-binding protein
MGSGASLVIAVDTNILVRYAIKDDRSQTETATRFLLHNQCLLLATVALETVWVLSSKKAYALPRETVVERMRHIAGLPTITVLEAKALDLALQWYESGIDFADALHFAISNQYAGLATLDKKMWLCAERLGLAERLVLLPSAENEV